MLKSTRIAGGTLLPVLLALLLVPAAPGILDAREPSNVLEIRIFHVGALVTGKKDFIGEVPPPILPPDVRDQENPLFGAEAEEPVLPYGSIDELIELLKGAVDPVFWEETQGADMRSMGWTTLVVRATPAVHAKIGAFLAKRESASLRSMRIEVQAVPAEDVGGLPKDPAGIAALLAKPEAGPAVSLVAWPGQRASAVNGRQFAYVADYDVSVAQESEISDPIIGVANLGLMVDARATQKGAGDTSIVNAWIRLAELDGRRNVTTGEHRAVDAPTFETAVVHALVEAHAGMWTHAGGGAGWAFFLRVTPAAYEASPSRSAVLPSMRRTTGAFQLRYFRVTDLATNVESHTPTAPGHLWPTRYTPPEPPELWEPYPFVPQEALVELIRDLGTGPTWEDPAALEARNGVLIGRNDSAVLEGTARAIEILRNEFMWTVANEVEVLEMPADLARSLVAASDPTLVLNAAATGALAAAREDGLVHRVAGATVLNRRTARNCVEAGRQVLYLQDYAVEIAQGAAIGDPVIMKFFAGLQVDLFSQLTSGRDAVAMEVRFRQTEAGESMRTLETPLGKVELPELDVFRVRTSCTVPLGRTIMVGSRGDGEHRQVLLLTPTLRRAR